MSQALHLGLLASFGDEDGWGSWIYWTWQLSVVAAVAWPSVAAVSVVVLLQQQLLPVAVVEQPTAAVVSFASVVETEEAVVAESLYLAVTAGSSSAAC